MSTIHEMRKIIVLIFVLFVFSGIGVGVFVYEARVSRGNFVGEKAFHIERGEDILSIAKRLEEERLIASRWFFLWSAWRGGLQGKIHAGDFVIPGKLTASEIGVIFLKEEGKPQEITLTFPEGWESKKIAARLSANHFDGEGFLELVDKPLPEWADRFFFVRDIPEGASIEGFLFPDTYTFRLSASPRDIIEKMLKNFESKFDEDIQKEILRQGKNIFDIVIMASILEREIGVSGQGLADIERERKIVSDIFWRRIADGHPLESCATVQYVLGTSKGQLSFEETRTKSPYNTYINKGLPVGPISNPGSISIRAAVFPTPNEYYYFLNNPETGETFFAKTFEEHTLNKAKNGL